MPGPVINLSTPPPPSAGRPSAANEPEAASDANTPFSDVLAQKLDQTSPRSDKPAASDSEKKDVAAGDDIAAMAAPAGQILPPDGNTLQLALNVSPPAIATTSTPPVQQEGDGAAATASFSSVAVLNGTAAAQPVNPGDGESNFEDQDAQQIQASGQLSTQASEQSLVRGRSLGQAGDLSADLVQQSAANTFSIENMQHLANENPVAGKVAEGVSQALAGLAAQPNAATASPTLGTVNALSGASTHNAHSAAPLVSTPIPLPLTHPDWDQALGQRVMWLVKQDMQGAELRINPPQLGPIEMRIVMNNDQTSVSFTSQHAAVREALEAAVPRLRDMFSDNGLNLANVNVSQHSFAQQRQDNPHTPGAAASSGYQDEAQPVDGRVSDTPARVLAGLVDFYA
ncbi:MAG TPA: flagellar hook-length control protein FliK [Gammaproteobacteria bacterium]|nr:flagellar hook-length control protein FliK [Gammaproteobacteria bacterium]